MALITFGMLSDIQYADIDDGTSFHGIMRHYRESLNCLKQAINTWNQHSITKQSKSEKISFILDLGDIIDGKNKEKSEEAMERVLQSFNEFTTGPIYHLLGNHCLYHLTRDIIHPKYSLTRSSGNLQASIDDVISGPEPTSEDGIITKKRKVEDSATSATTTTTTTNDQHATDSNSTNNTTTSSSTTNPTTSKAGDDLILQNAHHYHSFTPHKSVRFLLLDTYDISLLGWPEGHPHIAMATAILDKNNPNKEKNSSKGLYGKNKRFVAYNGGIGEEQLKWMKQELDEALALKQMVILCSHVPLVAVVSGTSSFLWNCDEVLELIDKYPNVVCYLSGHDHDGGYVLRKKVHHYVLPAIVECVQGSNAYATVEIHNDHMKINGYGIIKSVKLPFSYIPSH